MKIAVVGATSKTGRHLVARLCDDGHEVTAIGRSRARLDALDARARRATSDLEQPRTLVGALDGAECVISLAHARYTQAVLDALPASCEHFVLTGSSRKFTALPDAAAEAVRRGEAACRASGRRGIMLHPTMIYGGPDDRSVNRLLRFIRGWPRWAPLLVPLPDGGRHTVQPVFIDDVVDAFVAAAVGKVAGEPIVVAGPDPISYAAMVRACAAALGRRAVIVPVPLFILAAGLWCLRAVGARPPFEIAEVRRATEDKAFAIDDFTTRLGVTPCTFAEGLHRKLDRGWL